MRAQHVGDLLPFHGIVRQKEVHCAVQLPAMPALRIGRYALVTAGSQKGAYHDQQRLHAGDHISEESGFSLTHTGSKPQLETEGQASA